MTAPRADGDQQHRLILLGHAQVDQQAADGHHGHIAQRQGGEAGGDKGPEVEIHGILDVQLAGGPA
jgi:hypothetical protein